MKYEFETMTIGDCCDIIKKSIYPEKGQVYTCFSLPAFDNSNTPEILNGEEIKSSKFVLDENTILFNKLNPKFRRVWNIHSLEKYENTICSTEFLPLKAKANIEQDYLYYYISSPYFTRLMDGIRTGTSNSQQRIDWKQFLREQINVPSLPIQRKVVSLLSNIDKKIKLNNKINNNLEQQAQAIFKSWFVDFELNYGIMPSDWKVSQLGSIAQISTEVFSPAKNPNVEVEHYSIPAYDEKRYPVFETSNGIKSNKYRLSSNSVMISKLNPDTKRIWRPYCISDNPICSTEFIVYEPINPLNRDFIYSIIDSIGFSAFLCSHTTGSTNSRQRATPSITLTYDIIVPDEKTIQAFCSIVSPMYDTIENNIKENQKLAETRDKLLPKLMSGKLDVSDIDL